MHVERVPQVSPGRAIVPLLAATPTTHQGEAHAAVAHGLTIRYRVQ